MGNKSKIKKNISVKYELDKERNLKFGMNALSLIEEELGISVSELNLEGLSFKMVRAIIWGGLAQEDETLTINQVGDLIDEYSDIQEAAKKLNEAFTKAFGTKEDVKN